MDHVFDFAPLVTALCQAIPVWAIVATAVTYYLRKSKDARDESNKRLIAIETSIRAIQLSLASAGLDSVAKDVQELRESKAKLSAEIVSIWRALEDGRLLQLSKVRHELD